jgi:hypothetical protein
MRATGTARYSPKAYANAGSVTIFGRRIPMLADAADDAAILAAVVADANATESIHKEMIQHMADWEAQQPGILTTDDDLRNQFIANLEGLRSAYVDRGLGLVGVSIPALLNRANPAHAVILSVRDDIADTRDQLQANNAQNVLSKQIQSVSMSLPEQLARQAADAVSDTASALKTGVQGGAQAVQSFATTLAWIAGGGLGLYLLTQMVGGRK